MNKQNTQQKANSKKRIAKSDKLSTQPYKGARDLYPEDMRVRNYIFDAWKKVCKRYGFEEYDFPILEPFEIFAAKTGEEIVNKQMFTLTDKAGRKLAIRPELTPGTTRMIAQEFNKLPKPIKWFMIGNNWRSEKPQKGRGREFYQLEMNIFGIKEVEADFEIFQAIIDIMKEFGANEKQFRIYFNDRRVIYALLQGLLNLPEKVMLKTRRLMDKRQKISKEKFLKELDKLGLTEDQSEKIQDFLNSNFETLERVIPSNMLKKNEGYKAMKRLTELLGKNDLAKYCEFDPSIIRGFDYSDGLVYEVFDLNPTNKRSMFGGERFDGLIKIFGDYDLPATGFAMGDITLLEFLKNWNLLPTLPTETKVYVTIFDEKTKDKSFEIAQKLREAGINTDSALEATKLDKQLKYADRKEVPYVIIIGPDEIKKGTVMLRNMKKKQQEEMTIEKVITKLKE